MKRARIGIEGRSNRSVPVDSEPLGCRRFEDADLSVADGVSVVFDVDAFDVGLRSGVASVM